VWALEGFVVGVVVACWAGVLLFGGGGVVVFFEAAAFHGFDDACADADFVCDDFGDAAGVAVFVVVSLGEAACYHDSGAFGGYACEVFCDFAPCGDVDEACFCLPFSVVVSPVAVYGYADVGACAAVCGDFEFDVVGDVADDGDCGCA
jgi:hypothetical protein